MRKFTTILSLAAALAFPFIMAATATAAPGASPIQMGTDATVDAHDSQTWSGTTKTLDALDDGFQAALEQGLANSKYAEMAGKAGKYVKVLDYVLKAVKFGNMGNKCRIAWRDGDRATFIREYDNIVREALKTAAGLAGATAGATYGGTAGTLAGGGIASIITGGIGVVAGGMLGDYLASTAAGEAYDAFLSDWVKDGIGDVFDQYHGGTKPDGSGTGLPLPDDGDDAKDEDDKPLVMDKFGT